MAAAKRIICVGHAALDRIYRIDAFPAQPTKVRALEHIEAGGGMAANAAVAIARLGGAAELWSRVGDDNAGHAIRAQVDVSDPEGHHVVRNAEGDGPVAALFAALAAATGVDFELESYEVHSMGVGRDARGEANLSARIDGRMLSGQGTSRDVLEASAIAWLDVANHMLRERQALRSVVGA